MDLRILGVLSFSFSPVRGGLRRNTLEVGGEVCGVE